LDPPGEGTVSRLLQRPRRPPSQTWRTFLTNHGGTLVSMDFFTVSTLTGRVVFVLVAAVQVTKHVCTPRQAARIDANPARHHYEQTP
jgi:hypothetical protein